MVSGVQFLEQGLGLLQVKRVKTFSEQVIDRSEKIVGFLPFPMPALEPRHAHRCVKLPRLRLP